jgi:anaerobic selenocysteine-containing dehydrogenase
VVPTELGEGEWYCSTRRGKQFNSMIHAEIDPLTGAGRDAVYLDTHDAATLGVADGQQVVLRSEHGEMRGRARLVRLPARTVQVHWPEGNVLLSPTLREPASKIPDYNATVRIEVP